MCNALYLYLCSSHHRHYSAPNVKQLVFRILPPFVQGLIRTWYYLRKFSRVRAEDEKDLGLVCRLVRPGDTVFDIGANFGMYTKILAECVGTGGRVYSFEPVPQTFHVLQHNVRSTNLNQVSPLCLAASSTTGKATISIPTYSDGGENMYEASLERSGTGAGIEISTVRLDEQYADLDRLDFVKLDVEGHEPAVLDGMQKIIRRHHPAFLIEINDGFTSGSTGSTVARFMHSLGYSMHYFDGTVVRPSQGGEQGVNYLFMHTQHQHEDRR